MKIMVVDGQGGGIGAAVIKGLRQALGENVVILALGTNSIATARMMKAGANRGATGEHAIEVTSRSADVIVGPLAALVADAMMGEVTPRMVAALGASPARKILIPLLQEKVTVVGVVYEPLPHLVERVLEEIKELIRDV